MAFTQEQLTALEAALAEGTRTVKYRDREITYRTVDEMLKLRDLIRRDLGLVKKTARLKGEFSKGLK
jgi:thiamine monophosphate synthase